MEKLRLAAADQPAKEVEVNLTEEPVMPAVNPERRSPFSIGQSKPIEDATVPCYDAMHRTKSWRRIVSGRR